MSDSLNHKPLEQFVQQHEQSQFFIGEQGVRLHTLLYPKANNCCVLIAPGRAEVAFKYRELAYDLWQQGYAVAVIDHRGQGLSQRFFSDMQLGHMDDFEYAASDLQQFASQLKQQYPQLLLLAHSMGGAIGCRVLQRDSGLFMAAAINCPMLSLETGIIPPAIAPLLLAPIVVWDRLAWQLKRRKPKFISPSRGESAVQPFAENRITSSAERYHSIQQQLANHPDYALGGPTAQWAQQAFIMMQRIQQQAKQITTPLLILQGGKDQVVTPSGQSNLAMLLSQHHRDSQLLRIDQGMHELLMEREPLREAALSSIYSWFRKGLSK